MENARTTQSPDINRPIQSLTTIKTNATPKEKSLTTHKPKAASTAVPANHRPTWVRLKQNARSFMEIGYFHMMNEEKMPHIYRFRMHWKSK